MALPTPVPAARVSPTRGGSPTRRKSPQRDSVSTDLYESATLLVPGIQKLLQKGVTKSGMSKLIADGTVTFNCQPDTAVVRTSAGIYRYRDEVPNTYLVTGSGRRGRKSPRATSRSPRATSKSPVKRGRGRPKKTDTSPRAAGTTQARKGKTQQDVGQFVYDKLLTAINKGKLLNVDNFDPVTGTGLRQVNVPPANSKFLVYDIQDGTGRQFVASNPEAARVFNDYYGIGKQLAGQVGMTIQPSTSQITNIPVNTSQLPAFASQTRRSSPARVSQLPTATAVGPRSQPTSPRQLASSIPAYTPVASQIPTATAVGLRSQPTSPRQLAGAIPAYTPVAPQIPTTVNQPVLGSSFAGRVPPVGTSTLPQSGFGSIRPTDF